MASLFALDFEGGTPPATITTADPEFSYASGDVTYNSDALFGSVAMRAQTGATAADALVTPPLWALRSVSYIRMYVKLTKTPVLFYLVQHQTSSAVRAVLRVNADGSLRMRSSSANIGSTVGSAGTLNTSTWTRLEWAVTATTQQLKVFTGANVNGTTPDFDSGSVASTLSGTFDRTSFGCTIDIANVGVLVDSVRADDTTWVGPSVSGPSTGTGTGTGANVYAGSGSGKRTPKGSGSGANVFAGSGSGKRTPKASGSGTFTYAGAGSGKRTPKASGTGSNAYSAAGSGKRTPKGSGVGANVFAGSGVGDAPTIPISEGAGSGSSAYAGSGSGFAPVVGPETGSGSGTSVYSGSGQGYRLSRGSGSGSTAFAGSGTGYRQSAGGGSGALAFVGAGQGVTVMSGSGSGSAEYVGAGAGTSYTGGPIVARALVGYLLDDNIICRLQDAGRYDVTG